MSRAALVALLLLGAAVSVVDAAGSAPGPSPRPGGRSGPALGVFPANATRVTARVVARKTYAVDSLAGRPAIDVSGSSIEALTLEIQEARPARPDVAMGPAAGTLEALSREPLPAIAVGQRIEATVTVVGDTQAHRWLISDVRVLAN